MSRQHGCSAFAKINLMLQKICTLEKTTVLLISLVCIAALTGRRTVVVVLLSYVRWGRFAVQWLKVEMPGEINSNQSVKTVIR